MDKQKQNLPCTLFISAHPDDIELGAGGTVIKLINLGWLVYFCILTVEKDKSRSIKRKQEAINSAKLLGVNLNKLIFLNLPDSSLECNGMIIKQLREALINKNVNPDIIFIHSSADSHNDHRAAHCIGLGAFRKKIILSFAVPKSLIVSNFKPKLYVDITAYYEIKLQAIRKHKSQYNRIDQQEIYNLNNNPANNLDFSKVEAFELLIQQGAEDKIKLVHTLNDCTFHRFWYSLINKRKPVMINSSLINRPDRRWDWSDDKDREGINLLRRSFDKFWVGNHLIEEYSHNHGNIESLLVDSDILLHGGPVSNMVSSRYFNHFKGLRYVINYSMPNHTDIHIYDRHSHKKIVAKYEHNEFNNLVPVSDVGILTIMQNPMNITKSLIGCMGIHGYGTLGCYKIISDRNHLKELLELISFPFKLGYQILIDYNVREHRVSLRKKSLYKINN